MRPLYMEDCYKKDFLARVVQAEGTAVELDETAFYPASGGQPGDTGVIIGRGGELYTVTDVRKENERIVHVVDKHGLVEGDHVKCVINWERRYRLMRMHTAAHVLSAVVSKDGALITGKQLGVDRSRIDFSLENFDKAKIGEIAGEANKIIEKGAGVRMYFLKRDEAMKIRGIIKLAEKMPPDVPEFRIVEIEKIDIQACGGTHVKNISEVGRIEVTGSENKGKTNRRMYYTLTE